ncbi:MAG: hypothetical protein K8S24_08090 [Candidatus Aegiribacteria sp.]|nr:hypothetical protein [Candidatus Aegiribacteria sp.]
MNHNRMVDLLLVRLTREDEKKKVIDLLMSELGMSREEARDKVDNSPNILSEGMEMEQGRILQDRMYPFVDLLPKHIKANPVDSTLKDSESEESSYELITDDDIHPVEDEDTEQHSDTGESGDIYYASSSVAEEEHSHKAFDEKDDDSLIITSASEEMLSVDRCHICGRTPVGDQKLAPCQTCGELTCSDCYNRKYHVCEKCVSAGKAVDRPLDSVPETRKEIHEEKPAEKTVSDSSKRKYRSARTRKRPDTSLQAIILLCLILVAAFVIIDPMNLLTSTDIDTGDITYDPVVIPDQSDTTLVTEPDTTVTPDDSLPADSTVFIRYVSLTEVSLPDSIEIAEEYSLPRTLTYSSIPGIEVQTDSLLIIAEFLGQLSYVYSIEFDAVSFIRTDDGFDILLMSIIHPEPAEKRAAMLGCLGTMLDSTTVDQMVLYYRENQYYDPNMFSFTADSFAVLSISNSPNFLQRKQAVLPETTELITGRILEWMTDLN